MGKRYSVAKQKEAVKALGMNGMNYERTSKALGMRVETLKSWAEKYPEMLRKGSEHLTSRIQKQGDSIAENFMDKVMAGKNLTMNRIVELVPQEKNLDTLLSVLEKLNLITDGNQLSSQTGSIFLQINNQLNQLSQNED